MRSLAAIAGMLVVVLRMVRVESMELSWQDAIVKVLEESLEPMHYHDIAQAVIDKGFRVNVGAIPANTVASVLSKSLRDRVIRVGGGRYTIPGGTSGHYRPVVEVTPPAEGDLDPAAGETEEMGLINAFGMFWRRTEVDWRTRTPRLLGVQQSGSQQVDFATQAGVYLLYDGNRVVYVGRVVEPRLATRLWEHTRDRLTGRWDRFSWFGVRSVTTSGVLSPIPSAGIEVRTLIATMEALLIEGLEPPQNRRQGDGFSAVEFLQVPDPALEEQRRRELLVDLIGDRRTW